VFKLTRLNLLGFKSFYTRTEIEFLGGITAVVGPNGCGKSNISDAISWVLGEQSSKSLRGSKMEDVIFNGSERRGPLPMAEVALTLTWVGSNGNGNGNGGGNNDHNFHFTFEIHTEFQYDASMGQSFKFEGTDSVWLYIDGRLVTDLVGVHASHDQFVDLDRDILDLVDGEWYRLDFFFAQRYEPQAHFRIATNVILDSLPIGTVSAVYD